MDAYMYKIYEAIVNSTNSELNLFFVIVAVAVPIAIIPLYTILLKDRKNSRQHESEKHDKHIERERELLYVMRETSGVIAENTTIISGLRSLIAASGEDTKNSIKGVHERLNFIAADVAETKATVKAVLSALNKTGN